MEIICRKYDGYNRALGKHIKSKRHYSEVMKREGFVSYEKGCELAQKARERSIKPYVLSPTGKGIIETVKMQKTKGGKVKLSDRTIDAMREIGAIKEMPKDIPKGDGGFYTPD